MVLAEAFAGHAFETVQVKVGDEWPHNSNAPQNSQEVQVYFEELGKGRLVPRWAGSGERIGEDSQSWI